MEVEAVVKEKRKRFTRILNIIPIGAGCEMKCEW